MSHELMFFGGFLIFIALMLAIDLGLFSKGDKPVSLKMASIMSAIWVLFSLGFYCFFVTMDLNYTTSMTWTTFRKSLPNTTMILKSFRVI